MKSRYSVLNRWFGAIPVALLAVALNGKSAVVYTDSASFLTAASGSTFFYNFNDLTLNGTESSISKSGGTPTFSYTITSSGGANGLFNLGDPRVGGGKSIIPSDAGANILITFTSGNVTAVGADFFLTKYSSGALNAGTLEITLSDGTFESNAYGGGEPVPFRGFTTTLGNPITSLTFHAATNTLSPTLDNLYVGAVPEGPAWLGAAFIGLVLGGRVIGKRLQSSRAD